MEGFLVLGNKPLQASWISNFDSVVALNKEYTVRHREQHMNIVPAVEAYAQWGGDY